MLVAAAMMIAANGAARAGAEAQVPVGQTAAALSSASTPLEREVDRLYRAYFLRSPDSPGLLYWVGLRGRGTSLATVSAEFSGSPEFAARYGSLTDRQFVDLVYRNVLGRDPDADGGGYWASELASRRLDRGEVMIGFSESLEFKLAVGHLDPGPISRLFRAFFLRDADPEGFAYWLARYDGGLSLPAIAGEFAAGSEFVGRYGSLDDSAFVDRVYRNVLGRPPDAGGRAFWVAQLAAGMSRGHLMVGFSESPENGGPLPSQPPDGSARQVGGCPLFPADSFWNARVDQLRVHASSSTWITSIGRSRTAHADFGSGLYNGAPIGIPYTVVDPPVPSTTVRFDYDDESDPGPYPIPRSASIEGGGDRHILVVESGRCLLSEIFYARWQSDGTLDAGSGARWNLASNDFRPLGWTSADAAGLPILPGLVRYDEVATGSIDHAIRFTAPLTQDRFVWPATHQAGRNDPSAPPMGTWVRLRADVDPAEFSGQARVIVEALRTHGAILADNGSAWYFSGAPDERWDNDDLRQLGLLTGSSFEVVDTSSLALSPDSGAVRG